MSWTAGFAIASARDVAKFYWDLLGPDRKIISEKSLKKQMEFQEIDLSGMKFDYGGGLMHTHANLTNFTSPVTFNEITSLIGHGGQTYGF